MPTSTHGVQQTKQGIYIKHWETVWPTPFKGCAWEKRITIPSPHDDLNIYTYIYELHMFKFNKFGEQKTYENSGKC